METKHNWRGNEPWKRKEPGARLNHKQRALQNRSERERSFMEDKAAQEVKVIFEKTKLWNMEHFHTFVVTVRNPLSKSEVMERMGKAFPNLELIEEGI